MSNYYEALRKIMSDGKLKKAKIKDLIREAGETDTKPTKVRRVRTKKEMSKNKRLNQFGGAADDIDLDRELEIGRDIDLIYDALLPKEKVGKKPVKSVRKSDKWDPIAQEETDLLAKYAKEDSLQQSRDLMQGGDKWRETLFEATDPNISSEERSALLDLGMKQKMAKALSDDDISYIIDNARNLNASGRDALEQLLIERGDVNKMFSLNNVLGNKFMNKDISNEARVKRYLDRMFAQADAQSDVDSKFIREAVEDPSAVGGFSDDTAVEMSGMSALDRGSMHNDIRQAMVIDRLKGGKPFLGEIDELLANPDIPTDLIRNSSRYKAWKNAEEARLNKILENRMALDSRVKEANRIASGYGKTLDEINDVHGRAATAPFREILDNENVDYILDQFEEARDLERRNPTPRARDYGDETLRLKDLLSGKAEIKDDRSLRKRRQMLEEAAGKIKGEGRNVSVRRFTPSGKPARYINVREKQLLREMYPSSKKETVNPEYREFLDRESRDLVSEVKDRRQKAANKIAEKYKYRNPVGWNSRDYADFAKGKTPKKTELESIRDNEAMIKELKDLEDKYTKYVGSRKFGKNKIEYSNKVSSAQGMRSSKWDKPATEVFIKNVAKENGFRFSEQMIERMLKMTKQQVIDFIDNIANPMPSQRKRKW